MRLSKILTGLSLAPDLTNWSLLLLHVLQKLHVWEVLLVLTQHMLTLKLEGGNVRRRPGKSNRARETHPTRGPGWFLWLCQPFIKSRWTYFLFPSSQGWRNRPSISREISWEQQQQQQQKDLSLSPCQSSVIKEII